MVIADPFRSCFSPPPSLSAASQQPVEVPPLARLSLFLHANGLCALLEPPSRSSLLPVCCATLSYSVARRPEQPSLSRPFPLPSNWRGRGLLENVHKQASEKSQKITC